MITTNITNNYSKLRLSLFFLPLFLLIAVSLFFYSQDAFSTEGYIQIQKKTFFFINHCLGQYPNIIFNLTQIGDALIFLSFLSIFVIYAPKIWESLLSGLLVSFIFSFFLKMIFAIPRPAAAFGDTSFIIIGRKLYGHNSFPSGHSITVFTILTVLLFAFMPKNLISRILWSFVIIIFGIIIILTRIGVGAHYPGDITVGSIIGYISGLSGIFISRKYKIWAWIGNKKYYPIFIVLFLVCCILLIKKIFNENLILFYLSFISLAVSLYKITVIYVKK